MAESLRRWKIDVAMLPINGRAPERRVAGNLWGREAAALARDILTAPIPVLIIPNSVAKLTPGTLPNSA